ncbi:UPF0147 family protein [Candidatus Woesearchaeota archaeon]|nr:UPF0147 family protein [Candidatus Woesearchaeota archaeon]
MAKIEDVNHILEQLRELSEDPAVPRNVRTKLTDTIKFLENSDEISVRANKALSELDSLADDNNMDAYTRTQIYNIVSLLEKL